MDIVDVLDAILGKSVGKGRSRKKPDRAELADPDMAKFTPDQRRKVAETLEAAATERGARNNAALAARGSMAGRKASGESGINEAMAQLPGRKKRRTDAEIIQLLRELRGEG